MTPGIFTAIACKMIVCLSPFISGRKTRGPGESADEVTLGVGLFLNIGHISSVGYRSESGGV